MNGNIEGNGIRDPMSANNLVQQVCIALSCSIIALPVSTGNCCQTSACDSANLCTALCFTNKLAGMQGNCM